MVLVSSAISSTPRSFASAPGPGSDLPFSQFEMVLAETPTFSARSAWERLRILRWVRIQLMVIPERVFRCQAYLAWVCLRKKDENGKPGILHVKCAASDGHWLFLSSANLTQYAFTTNMELGVLIAGGALPVQVEKHFERLIDTGVLLAV